MKNAMIVRDCGKYHFYICAYCKAGQHNDPEGYIPKFYSNQHAWDEGWRLVDVPGEEKSWICPKCAKGGA